MKKLLTILALICMVGFAGTAFAAKETVFHCGCNYDGTGLEWQELNINVNAGKDKPAGHANHVAGNLESCYDELEVFVGDYFRGYRDCEDPDVGADVPGVAECLAVPGDGHDFESSEGVQFNVGENCQQPD